MFSKPAPSTYTTPVKKPTAPTGVVTQPAQTPMAVTAMPPKPDLAAAVGSLMASVKGGAPIPQVAKGPAIQTLGAGPKIDPRLQPQIAAKPGPVVGPRRPVPLAQGFGLNPLIAALQGRRGVVGRF